MKFSLSLKHILMLGIPVSMGLTSCGDFITERPQTAIDQEAALDEMEDLAVAVNGLYNVMQSSGYYGKNFIVLPDCMSDNIKMSPTTSGRYTDANSLRLTPSSDYPGVFSTIYYGILCANNILNVVDDTEKIKGDADERARIKGEALFARALFHFDLLRFFGDITPGSALGVPIKLTDAIELPARNTTNEVYTQIHSDLDEAMTLLTNTGHADSDLSFYASKNAAMALKARVCLYQKDYANALNYADDVISTGDYTLLSNIGTAYKNFWANEAGAESIFELRFTDTDYLGFESIGSIFLTDGYGDLMPTDDIVDAFVGTDIRDNAIFETGTNRCMKYPGRGLLGLDNVRVLRLSEMYLIAAEAANANGNDAAALAYINDLRAKRGLPDLSSSGDVLEADIQDERRKELCFEGHRFFDLKRRGEAMFRGDCTGTATEDCNLDVNDYRYIIPLPISEINVNPNINQAPGY